MTFRTRLAQALLAAGAFAAAVTPSFAMQSAAGGPGLELGVGLGGSYNSGVSAFTVVPDANFGINTKFFGNPYTQIETDATFINNSAGTLTLSTFGILQPLLRDKNATAAFEGGFSNLSNSTGIALSGASSGGFLGGRVTIPQNGGNLSFNGMYRYHFEGPGFWQAGVGLTDKISNRSALQLDYYRFRSGLNTITAGIRFFIPTSAGQTRQMAGAPPEQQ